jgi:hypothetical protein
MRKLFNIYKFKTFNEKFETSISSNLTTHNITKLMQNTTTNISQTIINNTIPTSTDTINNIISSTSSITTKTSISKVNLYVQSIECLACTYYIHTIFLFCFFF